MRRLSWVLVAMTVLSAACSGGDAKSTATSADPASDGKTTPVAGDVPFLIPGYLPKGVTVRSGDIEPARQESEGWAATFGRPAGSKGFDGVIRASVTAQSADREVSEKESARLEHININGVRARVGTSELEGIWVDWWVSGQSVLVRGSEEERASVISVARAIRLGPSAAKTTIGPIPPGFVQVAASGLTGFGATSYTIHLGGSSTQLAFISATTVPVGFGSPALLTIGTKLRPVKVRGKAGYVGLDVAAIASLGSFKQASFAWMETPTLVVSVQGSMPENELLKIADGMRAVSQAEWREQVPAT